MMMAWTNSQSLVRLIKMCCLDSCRQKFASYGRKWDMESKEEVLAIKRQLLSWPWPVGSFLLWHYHSLHVHFDAQEPQLRQVGQYQKRTDIGTSKCG